MPGRANSTTASEQSVPLPRKVPSWAITPCVENAPSRKPTTVSTLPDVMIDAVVAETVSTIAAFFAMVRRNSR